ncbi:MAG: s-methyl-5-thioribose-1-phosphate isomerase [Burkholderiales bacterium]|nr:s-methyl-5-thioribose-1-phosphate isomerase [Burkholderiales bacterium]
MSAELRGLDGEYLEADLPLLVQRRGMAYWHDDHVRILDRRRLPHEQVELVCRSVEDVAIAIEEMAIQGAFTLSLAAGYGMALAIVDPATAAREGRLAAQRLVATRPTGLALKRMLEGIARTIAAAHAQGHDIRGAIVGAVDAMAQQWARQALATARHALPLLPDEGGVLTHCFADRSLLYLLLEARRAGRTIDLFCSETRPYLQGARLTALSAQQIGHKVTVITDGMGGFLMREGRVRMLVTAADRVCLDGTICNKVGTYQYALAARANGVPYYVLRQSGPDFESAGAADIHVEYRDAGPVLEFEGLRTAPDGVQGLYPAFDITPPELVTAIVTDRGLFLPSALRDYRSGGGPAGALPAS